MPTHISKRKPSAFKRPFQKFKHRQQVLSTFKKTFQKIKHFRPKVSERYTKFIESHPKYKPFLKQLPLILLTITIIILQHKTFFGVLFSIISTSIKDIAPGSSFLSHIGVFVTQFMTHFKKVSLITKLSSVATLVYLITDVIPTFMNRVQKNKHMSYPELFKDLFSNLQDVEREVDNRTRNINKDNETSNRNKQQADNKAAYEQRNAKRNASNLSITIPKYPNSSKSSSNLSSNSRKPHSTFSVSPLDEDWKTNKTIHRKSMDSFF